MRRLALFLLSLIVVVLLSANSQKTEAAVIFDNGGPDYRNGLFSDFAAIPPQQVGDNFALSAGMNVITDIHWWGGYDTPVPNNDAFFIRFFNINGGIPDINPFYNNVFVGSSVTRVDTGNKILAGPLVGNEVFEYSVDVAPFTLPAGPSFLLSIVNGSGIADTWFWATHGVFDTTAFIRPVDGSPWQVIPPFEMAFNLTSPVPEPSTFLLLGAGLAGVGLFRRKLRK